MRDASLEESVSKLSASERERVRLQRELDSRADDASRTAQLEQDNRRLAQDCAVDRRALAKLREELVEEKLKCDQIATDLDTINAQLNRLGLDKTFLDGEEAEIFSNE